MRRVGQHHRSDAARRVIDERHLAEDAKHRLGVDQTIAQANLDLAAFDDEQMFRRIASAENNVARP